MIFEDSRYETATVTAIAASDGVYRATILPRRQPPIPTDYTRYRVKYGDRLDLLAAQAYGDSELWWRIADANPEVIYPDDIAPGTVLRIPRMVVT